MAISFTNGGGALGHRRQGAYRPMSEINITPMVDVMLVLLIIFMVTAPLMTVGVPVDLPKTSARAINQPSEPLVVSITAKGKVFVQETEIPLDNLAARLRAITANRPDTKIFVRGDRTVAYGRIMQVMGTINAAGFSKVALIAEMQDVTPPKKGERKPPKSGKSKSKSNRNR